MGHASTAYQNTEHLLKKDGVPLTTFSRRFWDMKDPWVKDYLSEKVINMLKKYGFEYMKMDYNDNIGIGCDHEDSLGEGLRQNMEASVEFIKKVKEEVPGIILENCASGGHKLEPLMMSICSMASFSDAHETEEIPIIAANLHRAILPRQSQIWAVIRKNDSLKRIGYSITNTFLGRMCLSGDVTELSTEQWGVIQRGIDFYKNASNIIKIGKSHRIGPKIQSDRHPEGYQVVLRHNGVGETLIVIHTFNGVLPNEIKINLEEYGCRTSISNIYAYDNNADIKVVDNYLIFKPKENMCGTGIILK